MLYFAYGSNLCHRRIERRLGGCTPAGIGWLTGYEIRFHKASLDGSGKCNAYRTYTTADKVYGALFDLTKAQKVLLDGLEGPGYDSLPVLVQDAGGEREALTYLARPESIDDSLSPFDWYKAFVVEGAREVGLPDHYRASLERIRAIRDVDAARAAMNWSIVVGGVSNLS